MEEYIDLGLPSGKLWKSKPEKGYYIHNRAVEKFGSSLPSREDFKELVRRTSYKWDKNKKGMTFTGKNGNTLFLPARGCHYDSRVYNVGDVGYYWSATPYDDSDAYCLLFGNCDVYSDYDCVRSFSRSVVLVR